MKLKIILMFIFIASSCLSATEYYCDPARGSIVNNGSKTRPWSTLQDVFTNGKQFQAGDVIFLRNGFHGNTAISGNNRNYVKIQPQAGHKPLVGHISFDNASYWSIEGIRISLEGTGLHSKNYLVRASKKTAYITVKNSQIYSAWNSSRWTADNWYNNAANGFLMEGPHSLLQNNHIKNVNFAIEIRGRYSKIIGNTIENFMGDGIRGLASYCDYEQNLVKNCYDVTGYSKGDTQYPPNHDDGFQSYTKSVGGVEDVVTRVNLRGNTFISYTDPNQIEKTWMQGIGCFDGFFENWVIENNIIITDMWHGITFAGLKNSKIINNTVMPNPIVAPKNDSKIPWIMIAAHKSQKASSGNIVCNNLVHALRITGTAVIKNNMEISDYQNYFVNYEKMDLRLWSGSPAIDAGEARYASSKDIKGKRRPSGRNVDVGAHEYSGSDE